VRAEQCRNRRGGGHHRPFRGGTADHGAPDGREATGTGKIFELEKELSAITLIEKMKNFTQHKR